MTAGHDTRLEMVRFMEQQLIGPAAGETETLTGRERPTSRYLMGILFPQEQVAEAPSHNLGGPDDLPDDDDEAGSSEPEEEGQNGHQGEESLLCCPASGNRPRPESVSISTGRPWRSLSGAVATGRQMLPAGASGTRAPSN